MAAQILEGQSQRGDSTALVVLSLLPTVRTHYILLSKNHLML